LITAQNYYQLAQKCNGLFASFLRHLCQQTDYQDKCLKFPDMRASSANVNFVFSRIKHFELVDVRRKGVRRDGMTA
jgi:hypothetical protein